jgi:hypothetical protein
MAKCVVVFAAAQIFKNVRFRQRVNGEQRCA